MKPDPASLARLGIDIGKLTFDACLQLPDATTHSGLRIKPQMQPE